MATEIVRPNSNINTLWTSYAYTSMNNTLVYPDTDISGGSISAGPSDDNEAQEYGCNSPSNSGTITAADLYFYGNYGNEDGGSSSGFLSSVSLGGSYQSNLTGISTSPGYSWNIKSWTGLSISMASASPKIRFTSPSMGKHEDLWIKSAYIVLTYTPSGGGPVSNIKNRRLLTRFAR